MGKGLFWSVVGCFVASICSLAVSYYAWESDLEADIASNIASICTPISFVVAAAIFQYYVWKTHKGSNKHLKLFGLDLISALLHAATYTLVVYSLEMIDPAHFDLIIAKNDPLSVEEMAFYKNHYYKLTMTYSIVISLPIQLVSTIIILIATRKNTSTEHILDA